MAHRIAVAGLTFLFAMVVMPFATAQPLPDYCDSRLRPEPANPFGYRFRENRCEGIFVGVELSVNLSVRPVSIARYSSESRFLESDRIHLEWSPSVPAFDSRVQVKSIGFRSYYQMDTRVRAGEASFKWPAHIPASEGLLLQDLGVLVWQPHTGPLEDRVYLPAKVWRGADEVGPVAIVYASDVQLRDVDVQIARLGNDGYPSEYLDEMIDAPRLVVPTTMFQVTLPELEPGIYLVALRSMSVHGPLVAQIVISIAGTL